MFSSKPYFELLAEGKRTKRYPIGKVPFVIGSSEECDLIISHPSVNHRHIVISGNEGKFSAESIGHIPVSLNGSILSTQTLRSGDVIVIDDALEFVFRNPEEEREIAKADKEAKKKTPQQESTAAPRDTAGLRQRLLVPLSILGGMTVLLLLIFIIVRDPNRGLPALTVNTAASVSAAFEGAPVAGNVSAVSLPQCIVNAGQRGNMTAWVRVGDTAFWLLASRHHGAENLRAVEEDEDYAALRSDLTQQLWEGRRAEALRQFTLARSAYHKVLQLVPDAACSIHVIAASRLNVIGGN